MQILVTRVSVISFGATKNDSDNKSVGRFSVKKKNESALYINNS